MKKIRAINTHFWDDPYIQSLDKEQKLLFLYLLTNSLCNLVGIYEISVKRINFDTGLDEKKIISLLKKFELDRKIFYHLNHIIILKFLKNQSLNPNMVKGANDLLLELEEKFSNYTPFRTLSKAFKGFQTLRKYEYEYEYEIEEESKAEIAEENMPNMDNFNDPIFLNPKFKDIWGEWVKFRKEIKVPLTETSVKRQINKLKKYDIQTACDMLIQSIENSWHGIFELGKNVKQAPQPEMKGTSIPLTERLY